LALGLMALALAAVLALLAASLLAIERGSGGEEARAPANAAVGERREHQPAPGS
jgi:ferric-dicitrate binding protein FerR (iron transport regulator)